MSIEKLLIKQKNKMKKTEETSAILFNLNTTHKAKKAINMGFSRGTTTKSETSENFSGLSIWRSYIPAVRKCYFDVFIG